VDRVAADPTLIALADHAWPLPVGAPIRRVPIRPAPLYPWYAVRRVHGHPLAAQLIAATKQDTSFVRVPEEHWLPPTAALDQNAASATPL
jgi:hypothetical protein